MLAFGIGSLWFGLTAQDFEDALKKSGPAHLDLITGNLQNIANINNIRIENADDISVSFADVSEKDGVFWPIYTGVEIRFDIYIPKRIQDKLLLIKESRSESENFSVIIRYEYESTVVYVSYAAPFGYHRPSDAVVAVRKYLEDEFAKFGNGVEFETLGPSPFHANFWLKKYEKEDLSESNFIETDITVGEQGYNSIIYGYGRDIESDNDAMNVFAYEMSGKISRFYESVMLRNEMMSAVSDVDRHLDELIDIYSKTGIRSIFSRYLSSERISKDLLLALLDVERYKRRSSSLLSQIEKEASIKDYQIFWNKIVAASSEFKDVLPVTQIGDIVKIFEERHLKSRENITVLVAGVFGGIIGSALTFLLKT